MDKLKQKKILVVAVRAGEIMMKAGAEVYRVEDTITRICKACGMDYVDVFATPTGIFVTMDRGKKEDDTFTYIKRVKGAETDLNKISRVNEFSRTFTSTDMTVKEGLEMLDDIENDKPYPFPLRLLGACMVTSCFSYLFGGNAVDFCVAFVVGAICYTFSRVLARMDINFFIQGMCCCALAAFVTLVGTVSVENSNYGMIITGCLMLYVPGVAITNSIRDFLSGDMLSGIARMVEAFFTAVALAAGCGLVLKFWEMTGGLSV